MLSYYISYYKQKMLNEQGRKHREAASNLDEASVPTLGNLNIFQQLFKLTFDF